MFTDKRSGKIALIAHCILNQNSRASGLVEKPSMITEIAEFLAHNNISIIQMPCPEVAYAGVLESLKQKTNIAMKVVIGVDGSPSYSADNSGIFAAN